jgi:hypothetical protein
MKPDEVAVHEVDCHHVRIVLGLLRKGIPESRDTQARQAISLLNCTIFFGDLIIRWKMDFLGSVKQRPQSRNSSPR